MTRRRVRALVSGRVQGVWFRQSTLQRARELGLRGWVRNLRDGRVEAVLEGDPEQLEAGLAFLREGPRLARVSGVELADADANEALGVDFEVR